MDAVVAFSKVAQGFEEEGEEEFPGKSKRVESRESGTSNQKFKGLRREEKKDR